MIVNSPCISHSDFSVTNVVTDYTRSYYCNIRKSWYILIKERITVDVNCNFHEGTLPESINSEGLLRLYRQTRYEQR